MLAATPALDTAPALWQGCGMSQQAYSEITINGQRLPTLGSIRFDGGAATPGPSAVGRFEASATMTLTPEGSAKLIEFVGDLAKAARKKARETLLLHDIDDMRRASGYVIVPRDPGRLLAALMTLGIVVPQVELPP